MPRVNTAFPRLAWTRDDIRWPFVPRVTHSMARRISISRREGQRSRTSSSRPDQIANAEWIMSAPGSDEIKRVMLNCTDCHTVQRIFESRNTEAAFLKVFERMAGYYPGASDMHPQGRGGAPGRPPVPAAMAQKFAEYLATIN